MKYRKKPLVIEAYQTDKELNIETLEGTMHACEGDYIITGVSGEQYPCKPDIFKKTYEEITEETSDDDLISRQAAIDAILHNEDVYSNHFGDAPIDRYTVAIIDNDAQTLAQLPTIDPVKHGKWMRTPTWWAYCSVCGMEPPNESNETTDYCPNCGARMDM